MSDAPPPSDPSTYFRKGFGLKAEVQDELAADYDGRIVDLLRRQDFTLAVGDLTVRLAREFGFCYGVDRAVEYAYQTRRKFPDRRILLVVRLLRSARRRVGGARQRVVRRGGRGAPVGAGAQLSQA